MTRRARKMEDLLEDRAFAYHVGQLIGAAEMTAHWMSLQQDEGTQNMGHKLSEAVNWFFSEVTSQKS